MDSGLGGLPYLDWVRQKHPENRMIYLADHKGFPYGNRSSQYLKTRLYALCTLFIRHYHPDLIVLACNTASVTALYYL